MKRSRLERKHQFHAAPRTSRNLTLILAVDALACFSNKAQSRSMCCALEMMFTIAGEAWTSVIMAVFGAWMPSNNLRNQETKSRFIYRKLHPYSTPEHRRCFLGYLRILLGVCVCSVQHTYAARRQARQITHTLHKRLAHFREITIHIFPAMQTQDLDVLAEAELACRVLEPVSWP
jgi:hypothetical protein